MSRTQLMISLTVTGYWYYMCTAYWCNGGTITVNAIGITYYCQYYYYVLVLALVIL